MFLNIGNDEKLLVISPHIDDEVLGCGGFMTRFKSENIYLAEFTAGSSVRREEFKQFCAFMGIIHSTILFEDEYHLKLDKIGMFEMIGRIEKLIQEIKPNIVAVPHPSFNQDHMVINQASCAALRSKKKEIYMPELVLVYEYPQVNWRLSGEGFHPNFYLDITDVLDKKVDMLSIYKSQLVDDDYAISVNGMVDMAMYRGKEVSMKAAEAFEVKRCLVNGG